MQNSQKNFSKSSFNQFNFKKKQLKKKISDCLHVCQCGKQFLSFPAVYSHAKTKHNFKISSRIGDQGRKIVDKDSQIKIYYQILNSQLLDDLSYSQSNEQNQAIQVKVKQSSSRFNFINKIRNLEANEGIKNIYAVMVQFLNQCSNQYSLQGMNFTAQIMDLLTTCINEHYMHYDSSRILNDYCSQSTAETAPYFFNFFLIWYLPSKQKFIKENLSKVQALLRIWFKWLKEHSYTDLQNKKDENQSQLQSFKNSFIKNKQIQIDEKQQTVTKKEYVNQYQQLL